MIHWILFCYFGRSFVLRSSNSFFNSCFISFALAYIKKKKKKGGYVKIFVDLIWRGIEKYERNGTHMNVSGGASERAIQGPWKAQFVLFALSAPALVKI